MVRSLTLTDVLEALVAIRPEGLGQRVTATVIDSREAEPGTLFVAFEGEHADGHDYVDIVLDQRRHCRWC